jgi:hypothetical protein
MAARQSILGSRHTAKSRAISFARSEPIGIAANNQIEAPLKGVTIGGTSWPKTHTRAIAQ